MDESGNEKKFDLLEFWGLTTKELSEIVAENPSMRGNMFGFIAEYKLRKAWLMRPQVTNLSRPRSFDRKTKGDFKFEYKGLPIILEVKCLDTPKVKGDEQTGYSGTFQCNASDTTSVLLPNGETVITNCLAVGGFDVLAVCLFAFGSKWHYAFAANEDLPRTTWPKYSPEQQKYLLKSAMRITWPLQTPFSEDLFAVLDIIIGRKKEHA